MQQDSSFTRQRNMGGLKHLATLGIVNSRLAINALRFHREEHRGVIHVLVCQEVVKFDCSKCEKVFSDFSTLKVHVFAVHENATYPCELCDFKATKKVHLRRHIKVKHLQITYNCVVCSYKATSKHHLSQHYKTQKQCNQSQRKS